MPKHEAKSFSQVSFLEAVARRVRVDLVLKPVAPGTDKRLVSQFLGTQEPSGIVLATPRTVVTIRRTKGGERTRRGEKVFVPVGWDIGMSFELRGLWLQARTTVSGHSLFPLYPTRRVDAILVRQPERVLVSDRRQESRHTVDPTIPVWATLWSAEGLESGDFSSSQAGWLADRSEIGLGIKLSTIPQLTDGENVAIHLEIGRGQECLICRGVIKHITAHSQGSWIVGIGEVTYLEPGGEALRLTEFLAAPRQ